MVHIKRLDEMASSTGKYTWTVTKDDDNFNAMECLYDSSNDSDAFNQMGFNTAKDARKDVLKFVKFYMDEFKSGYFTAEVWDSNGELVSCDEIANGKIFNVYDLAGLQNAIGTKKGQKNVRKPCFAQRLQGNQ